MIGGHLKVRLVHSGLSPRDGNTDNPITPYQKLWAQCFQPEVCFSISMNVVKQAQRASSPLKQL